MSPHASFIGFCAECNSKQPFWASANLGVFICIKCSGIHRSLGVHISKVKSVSLDSWTADQVEHMKRWGNERANALYEECMPAGRKPREEDTSYVLESFIRDKYERKIWLKKDLDEEPIAQPKRSAKPKKKTAKPKKADSDDEQLDTPAAAAVSSDSEEKPKKSKKKSGSKKKGSAAPVDGAAPTVNTSAAAAAAAPVINDPFANPTSPTSTAAPATFEPDFSQFQSGPAPTAQTAFKGGFFTEQKQTTTTTTTTTTTQTSILPQNLFAPPQVASTPAPQPVTRPTAPAPTTASASLESLLFGGGEPAQTAPTGGGGADLVGLTGGAPTGPKKDATASILALYANNKPNAAPAQQSYGGGGGLNRAYPSLQPSYPPAPVYGMQQPMYPPQQQPIQMQPYGQYPNNQYQNYPPQQPMQMQSYAQPQHMQQFGIYQNRPPMQQQQPMQQPMQMGFGSVTPALLPTKNTQPAVDPLSFLM